MLSFDRYYARRLHKQEKAAADLEMTAMEKYILRELAKGGGTVVWLSERLKLDPGYVSRTVTVLELNRQVTRSRAPHDGRQREIQLTDWGRRVAQDLEELQEKRTREMLEILPQRQQKRLVRAMATVTEVFERDAAATFLECFRERWPGPSLPTRGRRASG